MILFFTASLQYASLIMQKLEKSCKEGAQRQQHD